MWIGNFRKLPERSAAGRVGGEVGGGGEGGVLLQAHAVRDVVRAVTPEIGARRTYARIGLSGKRLILGTA